jgi:hypothetical protein
MLLTKPLLASIIIAAGFQVGTSSAESLVQPLLANELSSGIFQQSPSLDRGPPKEAVKVCEGKQEGDSCEFEKRNGKKETGVCKKMRKEQLVCVPDKKHPPKKKPAEDKPGTPPAPPAPATPPPAPAMQ